MTREEARAAAAEAAVVLRMARRGVAVKDFSDAEVTTGANYFGRLYEELRELEMFEGPQLAVGILHSLCQMEGERRGILSPPGPDEDVPW